MIRYLTVHELLLIARAVNRGTDAIRDYGLLASAAARPSTTVFGVDPYPELFEKAAALLHSLARNHALIDGNKRTAFLAAALMLERNGVMLAALPDEQEPIMIAVAVGDMDVPDIAEHLRKWAE
ncbi:type II toxin-antitoxin system death-on-curing family toxin [Nocardia sp. NPDC050630]|uniref:type II toxin-antitoxin system death-on-curing family toxin n=1 Tax=Nocardia sp. NPDC050630 TaxID=3364321 RepID=UPI003794CBD5